MSQKELTRKILVTIIFALFSAVVSYIAKEALGSWGVLDTVSKKMGEWLKLHVTVDQAGWAVCSLLFVFLYGTAIFFLWHKYRRTRLDFTASESNSYEKNLDNSNEEHEAQRRRALISRARDLAHSYNSFHKAENFLSYIQRQRVYFDLEPYFSQDYHNNITIDSGRSIVVTSDGSSYGCQIFLREIARLENLWGFRP